MSSNYVTSKDGVDFGYDYDLSDDWDLNNTLVVRLYDPETGKNVDFLGGVEVPFEISDHGNIIVSNEIDEYLRQTAQDMADDLNGRF